MINIAKAKFSITLCFLPSIATLIRYYIMYNTQFQHYYYHNSSLFLIHITIVTISFIRLFKC